MRRVRHHSIPEGSILNNIDEFMKDFDEKAAAQRKAINACPHSARQPARSPAVWYCPACGHLELEGD